MMMASLISGDTGVMEPLEVYLLHPLGSACENKMPVKECYGKWYKRAHTVSANVIDKKSRK